jgi:hypothetical protein
MLMMKKTSEIIEHLIGNFCYVIVKVSHQLGIDRLCVMLELLIPPLPFGGCAAAADVCVCLHKADCLNTLTFKHRYVHTHTRTHIYTLIHKQTHNTHNIHILVHTHRCCCPWPACLTLTKSWVASTSSA